MLKSIISLVLGNLLNKRPGAKKVESFMAKYLQQLID